MLNVYISTGPFENSETYPQKNMHAHLHSQSVGASQALTSDPKSQDEDA